MNKVGFVEVDVCVCVHIFLPPSNRMGVLQASKPAEFAKALEATE